MLIIFYIFTAVNIILFIASLISDKKITVKSIIFLCGAILSIVSVMYMGQFTIYEYNDSIALQYTLLIAGNLFFIFSGVFLRDAVLFLKRRKIRKSGIKTYGILKEIQPTGYYSSSKNCRELILKFDYIKKDGTVASGEIRDSFDNPIESRLDIGQELPVIYLENMPGILAFEHSLDYNILNEGRKISEKITAALKKQ